MLIKLGKKKYFIPESWEKLNEKQCKILCKLFSESIPKEMIQSLFLARILKVRPPFKRAKQEQFYENLRILSSDINFPFRRIFSPREKFDKLPLKTQKKLNTIDLSDLEDLDPDIEFALKNIQVEEQLYMNKPLWIIKKYKRQVPKYYFKIGESIETNITISAFKEISRAYNKCLNEPNQKRFNKLVSCYFDVKSAPNWLMNLCFLYTQSFLEYLNNHPVYAVLFIGSEDNKVNFGIDGVLLNLVKLGYIENDKKEETLILDYLNMQLKELKSHIAQMRAYDKSDYEIAQQLEIPLKYIQIL
jgi:hypothetical protein